MLWSGDRFSQASLAKRREDGRLSWSPSAAFGSHSHLLHLCSLSPLLSLSLLFLHPFSLLLILCEWLSLLLLASSPQMEMREHLPSFFSGKVGHTDPLSRSFALEPGL